MIGVGYGCTRGSDVTRITCAAVRRVVRNGRVNESVYLSSALTRNQRRFTLSLLEFFTDKMAELLSVQIHVPLVLDDSGRFLEQTIFGVPAGMASPFGGIATRLKKVDNRTMETASAFTQLPKKKAIDIEFKDLTYTVSEGRKKGRPYIRNLTKFVLSMTPRPNLGAYLRNFAPNRPNCVYDHSSRACETVGLAPSKSVSEM